MHCSHFSWLLPLSSSNSLPSVVDEIYGSRIAEPQPNFTALLVGTAHTVGPLPRFVSFWIISCVASLSHDFWGIFPVHLVRPCYSVRPIVFLLSSVLESPLPNIECSRVFTLITPNFSLRMHSCWITYETETDSQTTWTFNSFMKHMVRLAAFEGGVMLGKTRRREVDVVIDGRFGSLAKNVISLSKHTSKKLNKFSLFGHCLNLPSLGTSSWY